MAPGPKGVKRPAGRCSQFPCPRRDAHDFDGVAGDVGGALLAFRTAGRLRNLSAADLDRQHAHVGSLQRQIEAL